MNKPCARITLDLQQASTPTFVAVKESDIGREIRITLSDGGFPYEISADCYAVLTGTKPDGNILYNHCDIEGNTIVYTVTEQTTAAAGRMKAEVKLYGANDQLVTSATFRIIIDGTVYDEGKVESKDEVSALTHLVSEAASVINNGNQMIEQGQQTIQSAETATQQATKAAEQAKKAADSINSSGGNADLKGAIITATGDSTVSATTGESTVGGYVRIIADLFGMEYENVAVSGATVASGISDGDGNTRFSVCSSISAMRTDADIILLSGGVNDQAMISRGYEEIGELTPDFKSVINTNTLYGGLEYLLRQAIYKWSNKTILFVIPHRMTNTMDYRTAIHAACKKYSIPVVDITETTPDFYLLDGFSEQYTANADGWHANEDGHNTFYVPRILAAVMENFRGRGETITLVDNNLENLIQGGGEVTYYPETAGFIRSNGTISTSTNYKRTDYLLLDGFEEAEYLSFVIKDTAMATWALFDADKKWLYSSEDVNGTEYYTTIQNGAEVSYGLLKKVLSITELKQSYPAAKYIVLSTCNQANLHETVLNQNGEDVGWGSTPQYITLR